MSTHRIRILHVSDLHERGPRERERFRRHRVLGEAWKRNLDALCKDAIPDLVCFTGDLANFGLKDEYDEATTFVEGMLRRLGVSADRFFIVPGNHDVLREPDPQQWEKLRSKLLKCDHTAVSRWMAARQGPKDQRPAGVPAGLRDRIEARQRTYRDWIEHTLNRSDLLPARSPHGRLGWRKMLSGFPFQVHVIGFDSAWLAGSDHDAEKLLLTDDQVGRLTTDEQGQPLAGFRLGLVHHPLSNLHSEDRRRCMPYLSAGVDLLLRGHLHREAILSEIDPDRALPTTLAAGCLYEGEGADRYPNSCHVIDVYIDEFGRPQHYELRLRGWSNAGHWHDDGSLYENAPNGRYHWGTQARLGNDSGIVNPRWGGQTPLGNDSKIVNQSLSVGGSPESMDEEHQHPFLNRLYDEISARSQRRAAEPIRLFIGWTHKTEGFEDELTKRLAPDIEDERIAICDRMEEADIYTPLVCAGNIVSPEFEDDLEAALQRIGTLRILPIWLFPIHGTEHLQMILSTFGGVPIRNRTWWEGPDREEA